MSGCFIQYLLCVACNSNFNQSTDIVEWGGMFDIDADFIYIRYIKYIQPRKTQSVAKCYNICTIAIQRFQKRKMQSLKLVCLG